jgi:hypothetical protein
MSNLKELKTQIENANALGIANLTEKGVDVSADATTYDIMSKIADVSGGGGIQYKSLTLENSDNEDGDTITLIDTDGNTHTIKCVYTDKKITSISYDGKEVVLVYDVDELVKVGNTDIVTEVEDHTLQVDSIYEKMWKDTGLNLSQDYEQFRNTYGDLIVFYDINNSTIDCFASRGTDAGQFTFQWQYYNSHTKCFLSNIPVNGTDLKTMLKTIIATTEKFNIKTDAIRYDAYSKLYINGSSSQIQNLNYKPDYMEIIEF